MNVVAILAGGISERFLSNIPKQYHKLDGKMVIEFVIDSVIKSKKTEQIIISASEEYSEKYLKDICDKNNIDIVRSGKTRNKTLKNSIDHIAETYNCDKLIVCDAVRPFVTSGIIDLYYDYLDDYSAVVTAQKITDSLGCYKQKQINREDYYLMQSPEGFDFKMLYKYFDPDSTLTEVTQQLPDEARIKLHFDFKNNFKITYPEDLAYFAALINNRL